MNQTTIQRVVTCSGIGLHSGNKGYLALRPASANTGIIFDIHTPDGIRRVSPAPKAVATTVLATTLGSNGATVSTVEHLLASVLGLGIDNLIISVEGGEIPIMDGSGSTFVFLIRAAGIQEQDAPRKFVRVKKNVSIHVGDKWASLEPYDGYKLSFAIDFGHPAIDETAQFVEVDFNKENYIESVSHARTFGFVNDLEMLWGMGLAQGGTLDNAIVLDDFHVLNPGGLRSQDEFAKHKLLDAMGDLYVLGHPLVAHYRAFKSGHEINNKLLRTLLADPENWEFVEYQDEHSAPKAFTEAVKEPSN